jgi:hypothetical protein
MKRPSLDLTQRMKIAIALGVGTIAYSLTSQNYSDNNKTKNDKVFPNYAISDSLDHEFIKTEEVYNIYSGNIMLSLSVTDASGTKKIWTDITKKVNDTYILNGIDAVSTHIPVNDKPLILDIKDFDKEQAIFNKYLEKIHEYNKSKN